MRFIPFMKAIRTNCLSATKILGELAYNFELAPPVSNPVADLQETRAMLASARAELPDALLAFYEIVGAVEFTGRAPAGWTGCKYPDPLSIVPLEAPYWRGELEMWDDQPETDPDGLGRFTPQMSGDHIHKAGYSGGEYFMIFDGNADPTFWMNTRRMRFTKYLRLCNAWGYFPGLQGSPDHTWPLETIQLNFVKLPA